MELDTMRSQRMRRNVPNSKKNWKQPEPRPWMPSKSGMPSERQERKLFPKEFEQLKTDREQEPDFHHLKVALLF